MKHKKFRVTKDSSKIVLHKLTQAVIKKNPNIEKEHIITKIKKHERLYTLGLSFLFIIIIVSITLIVGTSYKYFKDINSYKSGVLVVNYKASNNGIGDIITLDDSFILDDNKVKNEDQYSFTITNNASCEVSYNISIRLDNDLIDLDNCRNNLFDYHNIRYNLNKGNVKSLKDLINDDQYLLASDVIPAKSTKVYTLNVWLDKETLMEGKHFHGIIEVDMVDRA